MKASVEVVEASMEVVEVSMKVVEASTISNSKTKSWMRPGKGQDASALPAVALNHIYGVASQGASCIHVYI